jgi:hypothetical protein
MLYLDVYGIEVHGSLGVEHHEASNDIASIVEGLVDMNVDLRFAAALPHAVSKAASSSSSMHCALYTPTGIA